MSKEVDVQAQIRKSVRTDGGYCHKLTNRFTIGIPDLLIALPPFVPCLIEVKDLKWCVSNFDRVAGTTLKQQYELDAICDVYNTRHGDPEIKVSGKLVHLVYDDEHLLVALPRYDDRVSARMLTDAARYRKRAVGGYWEIKPLLRWLGIAQMSGL